MRVPLFPILALVRKIFQTPDAPLVRTHVRETVISLGALGGYVPDGCPIVGRDASGVIPVGGDTVRVVAGIACCCGSGELPPAG